MKLSRLIFAIVAALGLVLSPVAEARNSAGHSATHYSSGKSHPPSYGKTTTRKSVSTYHPTKNATYHPHTSKKAEGVPRDKKGRSKRSSEAKHAFMKAHPCPATGKSSGACPGYVVDHVVPLKRHGADAPSNMQWQTKEAAKQKDKTE